MNMVVSYGYAVVGENGKLWSDECIGVTKDQLRIYDCPEAAKAHCVMDTDTVVRVRIEPADSGL